MKVPQNYYIIMAKQNIGVCVKYPLYKIGDLGRPDENKVAGHDRIGDYAT